MMLRAKNYKNRLMFHGVIKKISMAPFFETRCRSDLCGLTQHS